MMILSLFTSVALAAGGAMNSPNVAVAAANRLHKIVEKVKSVDRHSTRSALPGQTITINENEFNAYVANLAAQKGKGKVKSVKVTLAGEKLIKLTTVGHVEWKEIFKGDSDSLVAKLAAKAGALESTVEAQIQTASAKGKGYAKVLSVEINGIGLPESLIQRLVQYIGEKQRPPADYSRLFPLPYGIQKIDIQQGKAIVHF